MGIKATRNNRTVDPWNSDTLAYLHIQTSEYAGSFDDLTAPAAANYPPSLSGSPTRYFLDTPWIINVDDLAGSRPIIVKDVTTATTLTRVSGVPSTNEYRVPPDTSVRRHSIELHSGQAGNTIGLDLYAEGSVLDESDWNSPVITGVITGEDTTNATSKDTGAIISQGGIGAEDDIYSGGKITADDGIDIVTSGEIVEYRNSSGVESTARVKRKIIEIGDWNMDTTTSVSVTHNITDWKDIRAVTALIRSDSDLSNVRYTIVASAVPAAPDIEVWVDQVGATTIGLARRTTGRFDNTNFNSTSYNRGYIYIEYEL